MKRIAALLFAAAMLCMAAAAQQITRFGVVDTAKVYNAYFRNSAAVRNYEKKKSDAQEEINKRTEELRTLKAARLEETDEDRLSRLDADIEQKTQFLNEYAASKNMELETMKNSMQSSDSFYRKLYAVIGKVAESGGYSAILSLQQASGVLWYSPSVDITDEVIRALGK